MFLLVRECTIKKCETLFSGLCAPNTPNYLCKKFFAGAESFRLFIIIMISLFKAGKQEFVEC